MKKYQLAILTGGGNVLNHEVYAEYFYSTVGNATASSGCYSFYKKTERGYELVASYPIERTIIVDVIDIENNEN